MPSYFLLLPAALGLVRGDLSFIAIGDWGGESDEQPTTQSQKSTAAGMQAKATDLGIDFALLMGDNIYSHGVACSAESSSRFRETFQDVYWSLLPKLPFYVMAGNHDYGEGLSANVSAQVAYSTLDSQWRFPHLWYKINREFISDGHTRTLEVLIIDTVVLCGNGPANEMIIDNELRFLRPAARQLRSQSFRQAVAEEQWIWLERQLEASKADFLWVAGHYPIWSLGSRGSQQCLIDRLRPMLMKYGAHYLSGHDHMLEHFQYEGLHTFVAGAGKECCYPVGNLGQIPNGSMRYVLGGKHGDDVRVAVDVGLPVKPSSFPVHGGFASLRFSGDHVSVILHADNGDELYEAPPIPRRGREYVLPTKPVAQCIAVAIVAVVVACTLECILVQACTLLCEKRPRQDLAKPLLAS